MVEKIRECKSKREKEKKEGEKEERKATRLWHKISAVQ